jgi:hypothetical protein
MDEIEKKKKIKFDTIKRLRVILQFCMGKDGGG